MIWIKNELTIGRYDMARVFNVRVKIANVKEFAFWLKHYQTIDIDTFKQVARLANDGYDEEEVIKCLKSETSS